MAVVLPQRPPSNTVKGERPVQERGVAELVVHDAPAAPPPVSRGVNGTVAGKHDRRRAPRDPDTDKRLVPRTPKAQLFVTVCHWAITALLALNLLSGMRIGWGYLESPLGGSSGAWSAVLGSIAPKGTLFGVNLIDLHVGLAFLMLLVVGVYVGYLVRSRASQRFRVTPNDFHKLFTGLRRRHFWRNKAALWSANLLVYWVAFVFIGVLAVTGAALYRLDLGLSTVLGGYDFVRLLHGLVGYLLIPYTVLHVLLQWFFGRFWTIFKAQLWWPHVRAGLIGVAVAVPVVAGVYAVDAIPTTLTVPRVTGAPVLDGDPGDPVWALSPPVTIRTVKGVHAPDHTDVTIKAVHDGTHVYFQFQWADPDVSYKRYPLVKTASGWKVLQTAFEQADENEYYEDKLSMYITKVRNGSCATTCHLGVGPHSDRGEKHGLHYTAGEIGDVWHWKAVRTDNMGALTGEPGFMDDQYFGPPTRDRARLPVDPLPTNPKGRYTGGYYQDPDKGGGYAYNFVKLNPDKPLGETYVRPKFLPLSNATHWNPDPSTSEQGRTWWIHKSEGIPYTKEADTYPVGTIIPNMVLERFTGDRADVRAKAAWTKGRWTLEARRVLDTRSPYDVAFVPGKPVYVTVATYNRTQTRHGEHLAPVRVMLQP